MKIFSDKNIIVFWQNRFYIKIIKQFSLRSAPQQKQSRGMYKMIKAKEMQELGLLLNSTKAPFHFDADPDPRSRKYLQELLIKNKYQHFPPFFG